MGILAALISWALLACTAGLAVSGYVRMARADEILADLGYLPVFAAAAK